MKFSKSLIYLFLVLLVLLTCSGGLLAGGATPWDGTADISWYNSTDKTFEIGTAKELAGLAAIVNGTAGGGVQDSFAGKTVKLTADLDFGGVKDGDGKWSGTSWTSIGTTPYLTNGQWLCFRGVFDGNGHAAKNLYINITDKYSNYNGIFGVVYTAKIKNLHIESGSLTSAGNTMGALVGYANTGTVILNCSNNAAVEGSSMVGGLVGQMQATAAIPSYIINCYNTGNVTFTSTYGGGIAGASYGSFWNCYNTGNMTATSSTCNVGGLAGISYNITTFLNCYNSGTVSAPNATTSAKVGAFVGQGYSSDYSGRIYSTYNNNFYLQQVKGAHTMYGLGDDTSERAGVTGKTAADLKGLAGTLGDAYLADSENSNDGYPILKWQKQVDGQYQYDADESDGLAIDAATGIYDGTAAGFKIKLNRKLSYTNLTAESFQIAAKVNGSDVALENIAVAQNNGGEVTVLTVSFKSLWAERQTEYTIRFGEGAPVTLSFTTPASDLWTDYAAAGYAGGDGTAAKPYQIATAEQLAYLGKVSDLYEESFFVLTDDIDLTGKKWVSRDFNGCFDGQGHAIKNMTVDSTLYSGNFGFFARINNRTGMNPNYQHVSYVVNLNFDNPQITAATSGTAYTGAIAGLAIDTFISNCHVNGGSISGGITGGLVGHFRASQYVYGPVTVEGCSSSANITGRSTTGGIVATTNYGNTSYGSQVFKDCVTSGTIQGGTQTGGIIGYAQQAKGITVDTCYSTANIASIAGIVGGIVGTENISGSQAMGPLGLTLKNCVAAGATMTATEANAVKSGRIQGNAQTAVDAGLAILSNNYAKEDMTINGTYFIDDIANGANATKQDLATESFWSDTVGFDFSEGGAWAWDEGANLPKLKAGLYAMTVSIATQPANATVYNNQPALFGVEASGGTQNYTYQWSYSTNNGSSWSNIAAATASTLTVNKSAAYAKNNALFRCMVNDNSGNSIISNSAVLSVVDAKFTSRTATQNLQQYYVNRGYLSHAKEAFSLYTVMDDLSALAFTAKTYNKYFPLNSSAEAKGTYPWLYLDAYAYGLDVMDYAITGGGIPYNLNMIQYILDTQDADTGTLKGTTDARFAGHDFPTMFIALDMFYKGETKWGNEKEGTKLGRDGFIDSIMKELKPYAGGGKTFYTPSPTASYSTQPNFTYLAQSNFVLMMTRLVDDPVYGEKAEEAMYDVLQAMENLYDSGKFDDTEVVARYVSALIGAAEASDSYFKKVSYLNLAKELINDKILPSICADGSYALKVGTTSLTGDAHATAAVMMALGDFENESSLLTTYMYTMPASTAVVKDMDSLSIANPVTADLTLPAEGTFGSVITWSSSNEKAITAGGKVQRGKIDVFVTLTATVTNGDATAQKIFDLTVKADADGDTDAVDAALSAISMPIEVYQDITMPEPAVEGVTFSWQTSNAALIATDGAVTRPAEAAGDGSATLTVTAVLGDISKTKDFTIKVYAETTDKLKMAYYFTRNHYLQNRTIKGYWNAFAAYAALGDYVQDPANGYTLVLDLPKQDWYGSQYGATVLAICAMGGNPYNHNGTDWVALLKANFGGPWAGNVYSQLAMNAAGADKSTYPYGPGTGIGLTAPSTMTMGIDIAGWAAVILASHYGETGTVTAADDFVTYLKGLSIMDAGTIGTGNYISTSCAVLGLTALYSVGVEGADVTDAAWINSFSGKGPVDAAFDAVFSSQGISGYDTQVQMGLCDLYNVKYHSGIPGWIGCGVTKARLEAQISKAEAILENSGLYDADKIAALETALTAAQAIPETARNEQIAGYGKVYYDLYDAVRFIGGQQSVLSEDELAALAVEATIDALPAAEQVALTDKSAIETARDAYEALSDTQKELVPNLAKLTAAEAALAALMPSGDITVSFRLIGDTIHGDFDSHVSYVTWVATESHTISAGSSVGDLFAIAMDKAGLEYEGLANNYISEIKAPAALGGFWLSEFDNGEISGWMYTVNGDHPNVGLRDKILVDGDVVIWHYCDDYTKETYNPNSTPTHPERWLDAPDVNPGPKTEPEERVLTGAELAEWANAAKPKTVETKDGKVILSPAALNALKERGTDITLSIVKGDQGLVEILFKDGDTALDNLGELILLLPAKEMNSGTVAMLVGNDGETVIKKSVISDDNLYIPLQGSTKIRLKDNAKSFSDVGNHWAKNAIAFTSARDLFKGTGDAVFSPNATMTRAMFVTVLWRLEDEPNSGKNNFGDVSADAYYAKAVAWADKNHIVNGVGDGKFNPNGAINREQMVAMMSRYAAYLGEGIKGQQSNISGFSDYGKISGFAKTPFAWAFDAGLIKGKTATTLAPQGEATRAEVSTVLMRFVAHLTK